MRGGTIENFQFRGGRPRRDTVPNSTQSPENVSQTRADGTIEFSFDENEHDEDYQRLMRMQQLNQNNDQEVFNVKQKTPRSKSRSPQGYSNNRSNNIKITENQASMNSLSQNQYSD